MNNNNTFYTDKEIRDSQNIALSAWQKYELWYEQYVKEKAEAQAEYYKEIILKKSK